MFFVVFWVVFFWGGGAKITSMWTDIKYWLVDWSGPGLSSQRDSTQSWHYGKPNKANNTSERLQNVFDKLVHLRQKLLTYSFRQTSTSLPPCGDTECCKHTTLTLLQKAILVVSSLLYFWEGDGEGEVLSLRLQETATAEYMPSASRGGGERQFSLPHLTMRLPQFSIVNTHNKMLSKSIFNALNNQRPPPSPLHSPLLARTSSESSGSFACPVAGRGRRGNRPCWGRHGWWCWGRESGTCSRPEARPTWSLSSVWPPPRRSPETLIPFNTTATATNHQKSGECWTATDHINSRERWCY